MCVTRLLFLKNIRIFFGRRSMADPDGTYIFRKDMSRGVRIYRSQAPETSRLARSGQIINLGGVRKNWTRVILVTSPLQHPYQSITHPSWITPIWITPPNSMQGWYYEFLKFKMYFSIITKFYNIEG
jgi:hypothetical protein